MSDFLELLGQASGPGDVAIVLVVGPLGYVADVLFAAHGLLSPAAAGACCASAALGCKKAVESYGTRRSTRTARKKRMLDDRASRLKLAVERTQLALDQDDGASALSSCAMRTLDEDLSLWRDNLLSDDELDAALAEAIASHRTWLHERAARARRQHGARRRCAPSVCPARD